MEQRRIRIESGARRRPGRRALHYSIALLVVVGLVQVVLGFEQSADADEVSLSLTGKIADESCDCDYENELQLNLTGSLQESSYYGDQVVVDDLTVEETDGPEWALEDYGVYGGCLPPDVPCVSKSIDDSVEGTPTFNGEQYIAFAAPYPPVYEMYPAPEMDAVTPVYRSPNFDVSLSSDGTYATLTSNYYLNGPPNFSDRKVHPYLFDATTDEWVGEQDFSSTSYKYDIGSSPNDHYVGVIGVCLNEDEACSGYESHPYEVLASTDTSIVPVSPTANASERFPSLPEQGGVPNPAELPTTCLCGDPVNTATGRFVESRTDGAAPGRGVGVVEQRTYDSGAAGTQGRFGYGWSDALGAHLSTDPDSGVVTVVQENGASVSFTPIAGGYYAPNAGVLASLQQHADGTYVFKRDGSQDSYAFSAAGRLVSESDANGETTTFAYQDGNLASVTAASGRALAFTYDGSGRVTSMSDPMDRTTTYGYDSDGDLTSMTDPMGRVTTYGYGSGHLLTSVTAPAGGTTSVVYDAQGRVTKQTDPAGRVTTWAYSGDPTSADGGTTRLTDSHAVVTAYTYSHLELQSVTAALGTPREATTSYTYDAHMFGRTTTTSPDGKVTRTTYDGKGDVVSRTDPLGNTTTSDYNDLGEPTSVTTPTGRESSFFYDSAGNLLDSTDPAGETTTYRHDDPRHPGDVTSVTDPDGDVTAYTYDAAGNTSSVTVTPTSGDAATSHAAYDADGEQVCGVAAKQAAKGVSCPTELAVDPPAGAVSTVFNDDGEVTSTTDAGGHTSHATYDADGRVTRRTDADGNASAFVYDHDGRLTSSTTGADTATAATRTNAYDISAGAATCTGVSGTAYCTTATDAAGHVTTRFYDARGQQIEVKRPGGQATSYAYDVDGRLASNTDAAGHTLTYSYDDDGRLTGTSTGVATQDVTYSYDDDGLRTKMVDGTGTTTYKNDADGRATKITNGAGAVIQYAYDDAGRRAAVTYPDGKTVNYGYDDAGEPTSITDPAGHQNTFDYDPDGALEGATLGNGDTITNTVDPDDLLIGTTLADPDGPDGTDGGTLAAISYTRDSDGQLVTEGDSDAAAGATEATGFAYDANNRLTSQTAGDTDPSATVSFGYDQANNPTIVGDATQTFNAAGQVLTSGPVGAEDEGTSFAYDPNGNRTRGSPAAAGQGAGASYTYDRHNQMVTATTPDPTATGDQFHPVTPGRLVDTRSGSRSGTCTPSPCATLTAKGTLTFQVSGEAGLPSSGVQSVLLDVVTLGNTASGFLTAYPADVSLTGGRSASMTANETQSATVITKVSADGKVSIMSTVATDLLVDVEGWYSTPTGDQAQSGAMFYPVDGSRILDTRASSRTGVCTPSPCAAVPKGADLTVQFGGQGGIPATGVAAVAYTLTALNPTAAGSIGAWASDQPEPTPRSLSLVAGTPTSALVVSQVSADGKVTFHANGSGTDLMVGVAGYYTTSADGSGMVFIPADTAQRVLDTRSASRTGTCTPSPCSAITTSATTIAVAGHGGVPTAGATAVLLDATAISPVATGAMVFWNADQDKPPGRNLSYAAGQTTTGLLQLGLGDSGAINARAISNGADIFLDVRGWYVSASATTTYTYNGDGLRTSKTIRPGGANPTEVTTTYTYDPTSSVPRLLNETTGDRSTDYLYTPTGAPLEAITTDAGTGNVATRYFYVDNTDSTRALTDQTGAVTGSYTYSPFGKVTAHTGETTPLQFGGGYHDSESGLTYLLNRYYDPATASFTSQDPVQDLTRQAYTYTGNNPLNFTDPAGTCGGWAGLIGVGLVDLGEEIVSDGLATEAIPEEDEAICGILDGAEAADSVFDAIEGADEAGFEGGAFDDEAANEVAEEEEAQECDSSAANAEQKWAYRGVGRDHPGYDDALQGKVNPRNPNGTATPEQHNLGNTTDSPYTSWTRDPDIARRFAGPDGVVLRVPRGEGSPYKFEWSPDVFYEQEILIRGPVCGALIC